MCPEDSGSGWGLGSADLWGVIFLPGELTEIEAEPEQVGKTRLQLFRKGIWQGFGAPGQGGANSALESEPRN